VETVALALRVLLSLAVVLGLLWFLHRRLSRGTRARGSAVTVVSRQGIGQKASVVIVDADGKRFMLGVTEHAVNVLHTSDAPVPDAVAETAEPRESGAIVFARSLTSARSLAHPTTVTALGRRADVLPSGAGDFHGQTKGFLPAGRLGGSILSSATWKQAAATLWPGLNR
jgi:flagellar protein FliO/FliZ